MNGSDVIISGSCDENIVRICCAQTGWRLRDINFFRGKYQYLCFFLFNVYFGGHVKFDLRGKLHLNKEEVSFMVMYSSIDVNFGGTLVFQVT